MTVLATALAAFLAVLVMLNARVYSGGVPSLRQAAAVVSHRGRVVLTTTASGRIIESRPATATAATATQAPLVTAASGSLTGAGGDE